MRFITKSLLLSACIMSLIAISACSTSQQPEKKQQANLPPVIQDVIGPSEVMAATANQYTCSAYDPEGDILSYTWVADNGTIKGAGKTITWITPDTAGSHSLAVTVTDQKGNSSPELKKEIKVLIDVNGKFISEIPVELRLSFTSKDTVTVSKRLRIWMSAPIECIVENNSDNLTYTWTASNGKLQGKGLNEGTASSIEWIAPGVAGDYTVDVTVTDTQGNAAKGTINFDVFCCGN